MTDIITLLAECPVEATLAKDIENENGVVILKADTILTEKKIESLSKYGVINIVIKSEIKLSPDELDGKLKNIENNISKRMRRCEMTDEMVQFRNILVNHYSRNL